MRGLWKRPIYLCGDWRYGAQSIWWGSVIFTFKAIFERTRISYGRKISRSINRYCV